MVVLVLSLLQLRPQSGKHCQLQMPCLFLLREPLAWPQTRRHGWGSHDCKAQGMAAQGRGQGGTQIPDACCERTWQRARAGMPGCSKRMLTEGMCQHHAGAREPALMACAGITCHNERAWQGAWVRRHAWLPRECLSEGEGRPKQELREMCCLYCNCSCSYCCVIILLLSYCSCSCGCDHSGGHVVMPHGSGSGSRCCCCSEEEEKKGGLTL